MYMYILFICIFYHKKQPTQLFCKFIIVLRDRSTTTADLSLLACATVLFPAGTKFVFMHFLFYFIFPFFYDTQSVMQLVPQGATFQLCINQSILEKPILEISRFDRLNFHKSFILYINTLTCIKRGKKE